MYDAIARFYDLTHDALVEDLRLILALAEAAAGPVLELGCGTGRVLVPLARAGHAVVGVDRSAAMLARAQARLAVEPPDVQARITLVEADMTQFERQEQFALIVIPYNTLLHLDASAQQRLFQQVRRLLLPHGRLFVDLANPFELLDLPSDETFRQEAELRDPDTGDAITQWSRMVVAPDAQQVTIAWRYRLGEQVVGESTAVYHVQYPHQLEMMLQRAGLKLAALWGDYAQRPFAIDSDRLLLAAILA